MYNSSSMICLTIDAILHLMDMILIFIKIVQSYSFKNHGIVICFTFFFPLCLPVYYGKPQDGYARIHYRALYLFNDQLFSVLPHW